MHPAMSIHIYVAEAIVKDPIANITSANKITFFRPILSETYPENNEPTAAPNKASEKLLQSSQLKSRTKYL
jgi:hypothetical protein